MRAQHTRLSPLLALCLSLAGCQQPRVLPVPADIVLVQPGSSVLYSQTDHGRVAAWDAQTGETRWTAGDSVDGYPRSLIWNGDELLSYIGRAYQVLDAETGRQVAKGKLRGDLIGDVMWQGEWVYIEDLHYGFLAQDTRRDTLMWQRSSPITGGPGHWMAWDSAVFFMRGDAHFIDVLHRTSGDFLDSIPLAVEGDFASTKSACCKRAGDTALLAWDAGLAAFHLPTRRVLWRHALPDAPHATALQGTDAIWVAFSDSTELRCIDLRDGRIRKSYAHEPTDPGKQMLVQGDWIWFVQRGNLVALQTVPPYRSHETELPFRVRHGPFQVGQQLGLVLGDNSLYTCDLIPPR
jgi:PQQ-like domain